MNNIQNKIALVTGGADGFGHMFVERLLQNGAKVVVILDINTALGETRVTEFEKEFGKGRVMFLTCDVTNSTQIRECFKQVVDTLKGLDILINNAGLMSKNWKETVDVNFTAVIDCTFVAMDYMGKHKGGKGGTIVNISSAVGLALHPSIPVYTATKHGVIGFSLCMQANYAKTGVRFLTLCPGKTKSKMASEFYATKYDFVDQKVDLELWERFPTQEPENVGLGLIDTIQKGKNGAIIVVENDIPAYAVEIPYYPTMATSW